MTETAPPPLQQLEYGRPPASRWRRYRAAILVALVVLLVTGGYVVRNGRYLRITLEQKWRLYQDRRRYYETAAETLPANHLVWDSTGGKPVMDPAGRFELIWNWRRSLGPREPVLFQHEMRTASDLRVLVAVQYSSWSFTPRLIATMLRPGTLTSHPLPYGPFVVYDNDGLLGNNLKLYAGQVDPNDDRHFTIRYEIPGETGVLDGRMVDEPTATTYKNFGTIRLTRVRDAAATAATNPSPAP